METLEDRVRPTGFADVTHLEDYLSTPTRRLLDDVQSIDGDIMVLGAGGKMGITLCRLLKRAAPERRVIAVSRFGSGDLAAKLRSWDVETIACDLLDRAAVDRLPKVANVLFLAGRKFDSAGREPLMWAMNTIVPANVAEAFRDSRIVALSTIHVYPWSNPLRGGADESSGHGRLAGEYAYSVMGRERTFAHYAETFGTPIRVVRFVYAIEPRYGVLQEIATWVRSGTPVPLATGSVNLMWQGDAINHFARLLTHCTEGFEVLNVGDPEPVSVRRLALTLGELLGIEPVFEGEESDCLVVNCDRATRLLGRAVIDVRTMCEWVADWVVRDNPTLGLPSKFEVRSGVF